MKTKKQDVKNKLGRKKGSKNRTEEPAYHRFKQQAIIAVMSCKTIQEAAKKIGVSIPTFWKWRIREDFKRSLSAAQDEMFSESMGELGSMAKMGVAHLRDVLDPKNKKKYGVMARNQATALLFSFNFKAAERKERQQIMERIKLFEEWMEKNKHLRNVTEVKQLVGDDRGNVSVNGVGGQADGSVGSLEESGEESLGGENGTVQEGPGEHLPEGWADPGSMAGEGGPLVDP